MGLHCSYNLNCKLVFFLENRQLIHVGNVSAPDTFPSAVVEQDYGITIDAAKLVAVAVVGVPVFSVADTPASGPK